MRSAFVKRSVPLGFFMGIFIGFNVLADAQGMLDDSLEVQPAGPDYVTATFKGTRAVNFQTIESLGKRTLDFRISHRFSYLSDGAQNLYGLDGPASIRLGLEYSYDGKGMIGIGRSNTEKLFDGFAKYKLLRQVRGGTPFTMTILAGVNLTTQTDPNKDVNGFDRYQYFTDRLSYQYQLMIGRKFSENLSLQLAPTLVHFNIVSHMTDKNDIIAIVALGRMKLSKRTAFTAEYAYRLNNYSLDKSKYYDCISLGWDIETGGHVFQVFLTNAYGINESQTIPYSAGDILKGELRIGFNISRVFSL